MWGRRPPNLLELHEYLVEEHHYEGSYNSVLRYVRAKYPKPKIRTYRRVETPPEAQTQTDWGAYPAMDVGEGPQPLQAFVMALSHSRKTAIVWNRNQPLLSWIRGHNEAYRRLDGGAAVNRIDNVKTAIVQGAGGWGTSHPTYRTYARSVGFHIDACAPRAPKEKGKTEAKVKLSRQLVNPHQCYQGIEELQAEPHTRDAAVGKQRFDPLQKCVGNSPVRRFRRPSPRSTWREMTSNWSITRRRLGHCTTAWRFWNRLQIRLAHR